MSEQLKPWQIEPELYDQFLEKGSLSVGENVLLTYPTLNQVNDIFLLLQGEEALLPVNTQEIIDGIHDGQSIIAINNETGNTIGYQTFSPWPNLQKVELRSAKVVEEMRGKGINSVMKKLIVAIANSKYPEWEVFGDTEALSKSRGILLKLGFTEVPMDTVKEDMYEIGSLCPTNGACFINNGQDCGCKVFTLNQNEE